MNPSKKIAPWSEEGRVETEYSDIVDKFIQYILSGVAVSVFIPSFLKISLILSSRFNPNLDFEVYEILLGNIRSIKSAVSHLGLAASGGLLLTFLFPLVQEAGKRDSSETENPSSSARIIYLSQIQKFATLGLSILFLASFATSLPWISPVGWKNLGTAFVFLLLSAFSCAIQAVLPLLSGEVRIREAQSKRREIFYAERLQKTPFIKGHAYVRDVVYRGIYLDRYDIWVPILFALITATSTAVGLFNDDERIMFNILFILVSSVVMTLCLSFISSFNYFAVLKTRARHSARPPQRSRKHVHKGSQETEKVISPQRDGVLPVVISVSISLLSGAMIFLQIYMLSLTFLSAYAHILASFILGIIAFFTYCTVSLFRRIDSRKCQYEILSLQKEESKRYTRFSSAV
jgi:hypothetical protein